jgi:FkbM family methyltransferase
MSIKYKIIQAPVKYKAIIQKKRYLPEVTKFAKKHYKTKDKNLKLNNPLNNKSITINTDITEKPAQRMIYQGIDKKTKILNKYLQGADAFLDIGACYAEFALPIAQANKDKKVIALEPHPVSASHIQKSITKNKLNNLLLVEAAASNKLGKSKLIVPENNAGWSQVNNAQKGKGFDIKLVTIDSLTKDFKNVVVKIDTEGHELNVLSGMKKILSGKRLAAAMIEIQEENYDKIVSIMNKAGLKEIMKKNNDYIFVK